MRKKWSPGPSTAITYREAQRDYPDSPGLEGKWLQNISVSQPVIKNATATVMISFGDGDKGILAREKISLVKAGRSLEDR